MPSISGRPLCDDSIVSDSLVSLEDVCAALVCTGFVSGIYPLVDTCPMNVPSLYMPLSADIFAPIAFTRSEH